MSVGIPSTYTGSAARALAHLEQNRSTINLVSTPHSRWPFPPTSSHPKLLRISVLDSSFNPPTLAHLALMNSRRRDGPDYDARLLLLSVRNADKSLKSSDATHPQRLEMMFLLTQDIDSSSESEGPARNVAVAVIDEPTFVGKSKLLLSFLRGRMQTIDDGQLPSIQLTFLQGLDTLERLFSPHYYPSEASMNASLIDFFSPTGDDSSVVCARRGAKNDSRWDESRLPPLAKEFVATGKVVLIEIGGKEREISSTEVRHQRASGREGWRDLVGDRITRFIEGQGLYLNP